MPSPIIHSSGDVSADIIIVGSGVVGALMAYEMAKAGFSVAMLEAGPRMNRAAATESWRNIAFNNRLNSDFQSIFPQSPLASAPLYFPPNDYVALSGPDGKAFQQGYLRVVGGTTWHWAASCWRHLPVDFRMKSNYGVGRDWPISYDDLEPFYVRAEYAMGVSGPHNLNLASPSQRSKPYPRDMIPFGYLDRRFAQTVNPLGYKLIPIPQGRSIEPYEGRPACCGNNNCQPICPIGAMYNGIHHVDLAEKVGVAVLDQSVAYKFDVDSGNKVTAIYFYDANKVSHRATGRAFVLACNGIETPRLLLLGANDRNPNGMANSSDQVGRNMMDHSGTHCSFLAAEPVWMGRGPAQNSCMVGPRDGSFRSKYSATKIIVNNISRVPVATKAALAMGLAGRDLDAEIRRRTACSVDLSISLEPLPDPNNRLTLSKSRKDGLGLACPDIYYDVGDYVRQGAEVSRGQLQQIASAFRGSEVTISTGFNANNHVMGGVIMGANPKDSVTDGDCRAYDHVNLFLPGGGAMASASVVNTTLSMVALGIKSSDAIITDLSEGRL